MDEMDSDKKQPLERVELASERFAPPARREALALARDDTQGAQFTDISHFQPAGGKWTSGDETKYVASGPRESAAYNSISSPPSERDELESSDSNATGISGADHFEAMLFRLDRMRELEALTMKKVADSTLAGESKDSERALTLAREAMEALNRLRAVVLEELRIGSAGSQPNKDLQEWAAPMTSGVNLFDLLVMAKSNLAAQLRHAGRLDESLELYTQLCKLASNQSGAGRQPARFLLYRFGLQMGNVLLELGEPARALKHFRLTLDRLSSSGQQQLRVKLMNNIAIALMSSYQEQRSAPPDHLGATQRLLSENLLTGNSKTQQHRQEPLNANHHRFGLNLVASYHEQADLGSMRATLGLLANVDICHHYARVSFPFDSPDDNQEHDHNRNQQDDQSLGAAHAREQRAPTSGAGHEPRQRQVMSSMRADKLDSVICERRNEICRALRASCALVIGLAGRMESDTANKDATGGFDPIARQASRSEQALTSGRSSQAAATAQCIKLLASSDLYGQLAAELKLNNVLATLAGKRKLRSALRSLVQVARDEQRAGAASAGLVNAAARTKPSSQQVPLGHSPMVAANLALLYSAAGQAAKALELSALATRRAPLAHWEAQMNLANIHVAMKALERAEASLDCALSVKPTSWLINYNSILIARLACRHFDELDARTRKSLSDQLLEVQQPRALAKLSIAQLQLALLYKQSGMDAKSSALFERLAGGGAARLAPEVSLHASRATAAGLGPGDEAAIAMLRATNQRHAYHTPTAERLVALHISRFQYREAELLLAGCLRNRPDQAIWLQLLAECHRRAANYSAAIRVYKHAMRLFPADTSCLGALAKLADELGLSEERDLCQTRLKTISDSRVKLHAAGN